MHQVGLREVAAVREGANSRQPQHHPHGGSGLELSRLGALTATVLDMVLALLRTPESALDTTGG